MKADFLAEIENFHSNEPIRAETDASHKNLKYCKTKTRLSPMDTQNDFISHFSGKDLTPISIKKL